jgi:hypothetical protein
MLLKHKSFMPGISEVVKAALIPILSKSGPGSRIQIRGRRTLRRTAYAFFEDNPFGIIFQEIGGGKYILVIAIHTHKDHMDLQCIIHSEICS